MTPPATICIVGPTASGKSAVALRLAEAIGGEIISVDSMQVYRGLDIGTAKPTPMEQARVRHHLIDVVSLGEPFDAARFVQLAAHADAEIRSRGRMPIFCGGTGLYFRAFFDGLGESPSSDPLLRADLEKMPIHVLLAELRDRDPEMHARIDQKNLRRVIRALEVIRLTGRPFSAMRANWPSRGASSSPAAFWFGIERSAEELRHRIDERVNHMFALGLVEETRSLLGRGLDQNPTALQAIGYRQVVDHLRGERDLEATIALVKTKTRQFAKRQMTWFRRQPNLRWLEPGTALEQIISTIQRSNLA